MTPRVGERNQPVKFAGSLPQFSTAEDLGHEIEMYLAGGTYHGTGGGGTTVGCRKPMRDESMEARQAHDYCCLRSSSHRFQVSGGMFR